MRALQYLAIILLIYAIDFKIISFMCQIEWHFGLIFCSTYTILDDVFRENIKMKCSGWTICWIVLSNIQIQKWVFLSIIIL